MKQVKSKKWAKAVGVVALILLPVAIGMVYRNLTAYPEEITIATGPELGLYHPFGKALEAQIEAELEVECEVFETQGSLENLFLLQDAQNRPDGFRATQAATQEATQHRPVDFALYQPGTWEVWAATSPPTRPDEVAFVANLYSQPAHFIVRRGAGIDNIRDLLGKRVQIGLVGSGDDAMSTILVEHFGLTEAIVEMDTIVDLGTFNDPNKILAVRLDYEIVKEKLRDGSLDAALITVGVHAPVFKKIFATGTCELIEIPQVGALTTKQIALSAVSIPEGLYGSNPPVPFTDIQTVAFGAQLLTRTDVDAGLVHEVTRLVMSEDFQRRNNLIELSDHGQEFARRKPEFSMHPGARSFYDPDFDIHIVESVDALYSLVASVAIALFLLVRSVQNRRARNQEHRLDGYMGSLLDIERRQVSLDAELDANNLDALQKLLDEVTFLRQEALTAITAHEMNEDRTADSFVQMCHALSTKINAKISRQRLDQRVDRLIEALNQFDKGSQDEAQGN